MTTQSEPPDHWHPAQEPRRDITNQRPGEQQHLAPNAPAFDTGTIEAVKRANPLPAVLARYEIDVQGTGAHRMARCPFHEDMRPSLGIFLDTDRFFCFGCGASGDVIALVQQVEGIGFRDAIQRLMQSATSDVPPWQTNHATKSLARGAERGDASQHQPRILAPPTQSAQDGASCENVTRRITTSNTMPSEVSTCQLSIDRVLLTATAGIYQAVLRTSPVAHAYLRSRNIPTCVAQEAHLGYADGVSLLQYLGHDDELLRAAHRIGLLDEYGQERLRGRLIVPEFRTGQCIWLHGRLIPTKDSRPPRDEANGTDMQYHPVPPKYLGCALPKPLFGVGLCEQDRADAKGASRGNGRMRGGVLVVEGAFDALAVRTLRIPVRSVALIGTHAGPTQRRELLKLADGDSIWLALDADPAGDAGAKRLVTWLHDYPGAIYRVRPPRGANDMAELIEVAGWREARKALIDALRRCEQLKSATIMANSGLDLHRCEHAEISDGHGAEPKQRGYSAHGAQGAGQ